MNDIIDCPHCGTRMIPINGIKCVSCGKDITDQSAIKISIDEKEWEEHIYWGLRQNAKLDLLISELIEKGYDGELIHDYVSRRHERVIAKRHSIKVAKLYPAIGMTALGIIASTSYLLAIFGEIPFGIAFLGLIGVGLIMVVNAIFDLRTAV